jgi:hypothetical protein
MSIDNVNFSIFEKMSINYGRCPCNMANVHEITKKLFWP